jgi:hypothetical protein
MHVTQKVNSGNNLRIEGVRQLNKNFVHSNLC